MDFLAVANCHNLTHHCLDEPENASQPQLTLVKSDNRSNGQDNQALIFRKPPLILNDFEMAFAIRCDICVAKWPRFSNIPITD